MTSEQNKLSDARWDGVSVERLPIEVAAAEALAHVADGDNFGSMARHPTTIRTRQLLEKLAKAALSAPSPSPAPVVRELEWSTGWGVVKAETPIGHYFLADNLDGGFGVRLESMWNTWASSLEKAKAAAQADYNARILSALHPAIPDVSEAIHNQFRLEWDAAARPPVHLEPMRGRQTFESFESALRFMGKQPADAKFISLTQITSHSTDRSAEALSALNAAQGGK